MICVMCRTCCVYSAVLGGVFCITSAIAPINANQKSSSGKSTAVVGADRGEAFEDRPADGGILVGLEVTLGFWGVDQIVTSVQPIYGSDGPAKASKRYGIAWPNRVRVEAKSGYAVGAIQVKTSDHIDGMRVVFMRRKGDRLDPKDKYQSRWLGGTGGKKDQERDAADTKPRQLAGQGKPIIGVVGRLEQIPTAIGLIEAE